MKVCKDSYPLNENIQPFPDMDDREYQGLGYPGLEEERQMAAGGR